MFKVPKSGRGKGESDSNFNGGKRRGREIRSQSCPLQTKFVTSFVMPREEPQLFIQKMKQDLMGLEIGLKT